MINTSHAQDHEYHHIKQHHDQQNIYHRSHAIIFATLANACTNLIVTPGASADKSAMIAYNADSGSLYGQLYHYPAATPPKGSMRSIYDWDSGEYHGQIPEASTTYNVVGNTNEYGLVIGETTFGGLSSLQSQKGAKIDYGSLIWITLQRAKCAREAIELMDSLMQEYGYASEGESFSITDQHESWVMEIIGKGDYERGSVWVAVRVPDGYVSGHANQARITTFPLEDPEKALYSSDVISFARKIGIYPADARDEEFSFSDVYDAVTFEGARFCEARVWSLFSALMGVEWSARYLDYAEGRNLTNRMPLFVKPNDKVDVQKVISLMRNHYEGTTMDMTVDVGAGDGSMPYRWRPLTWTAANGSTFFNERAIGTPQTGWNFVAQSRADMPRELSALLWFGVDDSATTVHFPIYGSATRVPSSFGGQGPQDGVVPPMMQFDMNSAFYAFNLVSNWAYFRWNMIYPEVYDAIAAKEKSFFDEIWQVHGAS